MGRPGRAPGGWGAEDSGARAGPYPEATVICIAGYLGGRGAEIGHCCESLNEFVTLSLPGRKRGANSAILLCLDRRILCGYRPTIRAREADRESRRLVSPSNSKRPTRGNLAVAAYACRKRS